jgi:hypothetical protein
MEQVSGLLVDATIIYESISQKILNVVLKDENAQLTTISQVVDLKDVPPETVRIGFSAFTTSYRQRYYIHFLVFPFNFEHKLKKYVKLLSMI